MTEQEFLERWYQERPGVEAWGRHVARALVENLAPRVAPLSTDIFIRLPVNPRLKQDGSLLTKAFYRDKAYKNPFDDITDKVGVRLVVLLTREMALVCETIEACTDWLWSKDKDFEDERQKAPYEFKYQSDHYIVRCRADMDIAGVTVKAGASCEIQVRTLLQHAHSELTHDTIYKPSVVQTPEMHRAAAKAMALVEATNDYFEVLTDLIQRGVKPNRQLSQELGTLYRELIGMNADPTKAEGVLSDAYASFAGENPLDAVRSFISERLFVIERIKERAPNKLIFRQPSILLVYLAVSNNTRAASDAWPLTPDELKPILTDLGLAAPAS